MTALSVNMLNYPNCVFPLLDTDSFASLITHALRSKSPCSFIRLGDGEGVALSLSNESHLIDFNYLTRHFDSYGVTLRDLLRLRDSLRTAVMQADIVGIRKDIIGVSFDSSYLGDLEDVFEQEFKKCFPLRAVERNLPAADCRRLAQLHNYLHVSEFYEATKFVSSWTHWDLVTSGHLYRWLGQQSNIALITSRPRVADALRDIFSIRVQTYIVPTFRAEIEGKQPQLHFPERFDELYNNLTVDFPGMLFLVGAGLFGKVYCQWIKDRGGIALDVGAVLDAWDLRATRTAIFSDKFPDCELVNGVPAPLLLTRENVRKLT